MDRQELIRKIIRKKEFSQLTKKDVERIFEKFARVERKGRSKGLGLGLAFCRLAVEAHGGKIWVESGPEQGSAFYFTLPL